MYHSFLHTVCRGLYLVCREKSLFVRSDFAVHPVFYCCKEFSTNTKGTTNHEKGHIALRDMSLFSIYVRLYVQILYRFKAVRRRVRFRCKIFHLAQEVRFVGEIRMQYPFGRF